MTFNPDLYPWNMQHTSTVTLQNNSQHRQINTRKPQWAEENWNNSIHVNISTQFLTAFSCPVDRKVFKFYFCQARLLILHIFGVTCRSILSMYVCVQPCCEIYCLLCPLLCHCRTSNMGGRTDRCHTHSNTLSKNCCFEQLKWKDLLVKMDQMPLPWGKWLTNGAK